MRKFKQGSIHALAGLACWAVLWGGCGRRKKQPKKIPASGNRTQAQTAAMDGGPPDGDASTKQPRPTEPASLAGRPWDHGPLMGKKPDSIHFEPALKHAVGQSLRMKFAQGEKVVIVRLKYDRFALLPEDAPFRLQSRAALRRSKRWNVKTDAHTSRQIRGLQLARPRVEPRYRRAGNYLTLNGVRFGLDLVDADGNGRSRRLTSLQPWGRTLVLSKHDARSVPLEIPSSFKGPLLIQFDRLPPDAADLKRLSLLSSLELFVVLNNLADEAHFDALAALPNLRGVVVFYLSPGKGASNRQAHRLGPAATARKIAKLAKASNLRLLHVLDLPGADDAVKHIARLKSLTTLSLAGSKVTDQALAHLRGLTNLIRLDLSGTSVTDAGAVHLAKHRNLVSLDLSDTQLSDLGAARLAALGRLKHLALGGIRVGDEGLKSLAKGLSRLKRLDLTRTSVSETGLAALRKLSGLVEIRLPGPSFTRTSIATLGALAGLRALHVEPAPPPVPGEPRSKKTGRRVSRKSISRKAIAPLLGLTKLFAVRIRGAKVSWGAIMRLKAHPSLIRLEVHHGRRWRRWRYRLRAAARNPGFAVLKVLSLGHFSWYEQELAELADHRNLEVLQVDPKFNDSCLRKLGRLPNLHTLDLRWSGVTAAGLDQLTRYPKLKYVYFPRQFITDQALGVLATQPWFAAAKKLDLRGHPITDAGVPHLNRMTQLTELDLSNTKVTAQGIARIAGLTKLETLRMNPTALTAESAAALARLPALRRLGGEFRAYKHVTDPILAELGKIKKLEILNVEGSTITDAGLSHLRGLSKLKILNIGRTKIGDSGVRHLRKLRALRTLDLNRTAITDDAFKTLARMRGLSVIRLAGTNITGSGLRRLRGTFDELNLSYTSVTNGAIRSLRANVHTLYIYGTSITRKGLSSLAMKFLLGRVYVTKGTSLSCRDILRLEREGMKIETEDPMACINVK